MSLASVTRGRTGPSSPRVGTARATSGRTGRRTVTTSTTGLHGERRALVRVPFGLFHVVGGPFRNRKGPPLRVVRPGSCRGCPPSGSGKGALRGRSGIWATFHSLARPGASPGHSRQGRQEARTCVGIGGGYRRQGPPAPAHQGPRVGAAGLGPPQDVAGGRGRTRETGNIFLACTHVSL